MCVSGKKEGHSSVVAVGGDEVISAYRDAKDVKEERKAL